MLKRIALAAVFVVYGCFRRGGVAKAQRREGEEVQVDTAPGAAGILCPPAASC